MPAQRHPTKSIASRSSPEDRERSEALRLRCLRYMEVHRLTRAQMANRLGISVHTLHTWMADGLLSPKHHQAAETILSP